MTELGQILVVEDDPDIQDIAALSLESIGGFTVMACDSGEAALEALKSFTPQLIMLDVMMPELDGPSTYRAIRKIPGLAAVPVIFITAKVQRHEIDSYMALGAAGVIAKPFDPLALSETVRRMWSQQKKQR